MPWPLPRPATGSLLSCATGSRRRPIPTRLRAKQRRRRCPFWSRCSTRRNGDRGRARGRVGPRLRRGATRRHARAGRRAGRQRPLALHDHGRRRGGGRPDHRRKHWRQPGLLAGRQPCCCPAPHRRRFLGAGEHCRRNCAGGGLRAPGGAHHHPLGRRRCRLSRSDRGEFRCDRGGAAGAVHRWSVELLRRSPAARSGDPGLGDVLCPSQSPSA